MTLNLHTAESPQALLDFANGKKASGYIKCPPKRHLTDGQTLYLDDGTNDDTFEIDWDGGGVTGSNIAVDLSGVADDDPNGVAVVLAAAITGASVTFVPSVAAGDDKVSLLAAAVGAAGNNPIVQAMEGGGDVPYAFETEGVDGGADAVTTSDIVGIRRYDHLWYLFWSS